MCDLSVMISYHWSYYLFLFIWIVLIFSAPYIADYIDELIETHKENKRKKKEEEEIKGKIYRTRVNYYKGGGVSLGYEYVDPDDACYSKVEYLYPDDELTE